MALAKHSIVALWLLSLLVPCFCSLTNRRLEDDDPATAQFWSSATATWYGNAYGSGTNTGACGYQDAVGMAPFNSMITSVGPSLFKDGMGCGACYQVRCTSDPACSGNPVTVVVADQCPTCPADQVFFDMSGTAFGAMAACFSADHLRNAGRISVEYRRVPCRFRKTKINFRIDVGSNPYYLAVLVEYVGGDGDISLLEVAESNSGNWACMQHSWGALWKYNSGTAMPGPFSFRITSSSGKTIVAENAIPAGWQLGATYASTVNFKNKKH